MPFASLRRFAKRLKSNRNVHFFYGLVIWYGILCSPAYAELENHTLKSVPARVSFFFSQQPPFEYLDESGNAKGTVIHAAREMFNAIGWQVEFEHNSIARGIKQLHNADYDFTTIVSPTDEILQQFIVSELPFYSAQLVVYRLYTTDAVAQISALHGKEFAALSENEFPFLATETKPGWQVNRYNVSDEAQGLSLVKKGRAAYFLTYRQEGTGSAAKSDGLFIDKLADKPVFLAISRQHPNANVLMDQVNQYLKNQRQH